VEASWWPEARKGDLVAYLNDDENSRLLEAMEVCRAADGDLVLQKGSPSRSLLLVEEGRLEVFDESMGEPVILASVGPGGLVGEVGFVDGLARTHHVRARGDCLLRRLTRDALLELVKDDPVLFAKLTIALARLIARRFRSAVQELEPVRAFAASLHEPLDLEDGAAGFDEIEEALPETEEAAPESAEAVRILKRAARKARTTGSSGV
jgi:CRP-like cAMP-binding protein